MASDRNPLENFQEMRKKSPREFLTYLWDYYKWHGLIALALIAAVVSFAVHLATLKEPAFSALLMDAWSLEEPNPMAEDFAAFAGIDLGEYTISLEANMSMDDTLTQSSIDATQYFFTRTATGEIDAITMKPAQFFQYERDLFQDLRLCLPEALLASLEGRLYYIDAAGASPGSFDPDGMRDPMPVGIDLTGCAVFSQYYAFAEGNCILGLCCNAKNPENAAAFVSYLFPEDT